MPQHDAPAKPHVLRALGMALRQPLVFGLAVMLAHLALVLPMLARHHFDSSVFIVAGDRFVEAGATPTPIIVLPHSDGYDGQFYYRLALAPLLPEATAFGVTLDQPAWRAQRILLPLLARGLAFGQPALIPAALFVVNLTGLFAIGWLAMRMARAGGWTLAVPVAMAAWPGLLVALTRDTTEIVAAALLLAGVAAWLERRVALCAAAWALAALTRETSILVVGGMLLVCSWQCARPGGGARPWRAVACMAAAMVPFLLWRHAVVVLWGATPQTHGLAHNAGWPLMGWAQSVLAQVLGHAVGDARAPRNFAARVTALWGIGLISWFCVRTVPVAARLFRMRDAVGLAAGWLLVLALMCVLTAGGPWVEGAAYFRAFTECWLVGWCLVGLGGAWPRRWGWLLAASVPLFVRNVELWCVR